MRTAVTLMAAVRLSSNDLRSSDLRMTSHFNFEMHLAYAGGVSTCTGKRVSFLMHLILSPVAIRRVLEWETRTLHNRCRLALTLDFVIVFLHLARS